MTSARTPPRPKGPVVTAVLVCHDGAAWLPELLDCLAAQSRPPDRIVAADTGSVDGSADLVRAAMDPVAVVELDRAAPWASAVQAALPAPAGGQEWIWLIHDDCAPQPAALAELLARAEGQPSIAVVGPKVLGWHDSALLEAGLSIDSAGQVDTGTEGRELDQGQRDDVGDVLAVGTAGALVRRDVWERLGGLDARFALFGDDVDFGWRVNAAGDRVVVAPQAVVRHAAALTAGRRPADAVEGRPDVVRRRHALQVVLVNTSWLLVPLLVVRYLLAGLVRAAALTLFARQPSAAWTELVAVAGMLARLRGVAAARAERRRHRRVPHRRLRRLFPSPGARWRPALAAAGVLRGDDRVAAQTAHETGPVDEQSESMASGDSVVGRFLRRPPVLLFLTLSVLVLIVDRHVLSTSLHGGRLLPADGGAAGLWSLYLASWHPIGVGSTTPVPTAIGVLAAFATVLGGKVWLVVDVLLLGAVPLSALSAYSALRALTPAVRVRLWIAVVYGLLPAVTGAIAAGRIDVAVVAIVLPQLVRAVAASLRVDPRITGWHRSAGAGLLLALGCAFSPVLWLVAAAGVGLGLALGRKAVDRASLARRGVAALAVLVVPPLLLLPWTLHVVTTPSLLVAGLGLPDAYVAHAAPSGWSLLLLRAGGAAQPPLWVGVPLVAAALLGLRRTTHVLAARLGVGLLVVGLALAVAQTRAAGITDGLPASRYWPGVGLLVAGAGALIAVTVAAVGARPALAQRNFGWRQPAAVALVGFAIAATGTLVGGWLARGPGGPLRGNDPGTVPLFVAAELSVPDAPRALVLSERGPGVAYTLLRRPTGPRLGDADVLPQPTGAAARADRALAATVRDLVAGRPGAAAGLARFGIRYLVVPRARNAAAPGGGAPRLHAALGRAATLIAVPAPGAAVWRSTVIAGELTVLPPGAGTTAGGRRLLPAQYGAADTAVPAGPPGRTVVLAEPADAHWRATLDGRPLPRRTVDGWAQGFVLPPAAGRLRVGFQDQTRRPLLALELALLVVVGLLAMPAWRRSDPGRSR